MIETYPIFIKRTLQKCEKMEETHNQLMRVLDFHKSCLDQMPEFHLKQINKLETKLANHIPILQYLRNLNPQYSGNGNNMVAAYLETLPSDSWSIDLALYSYISVDFSITTVPDLSRFRSVEELILDGHEDLCCGFERIPTTVCRLSLYKTNFKSVDGLAGLTNVKAINLSRNYELSSLPDLSSLKNLRILNVGHTNIKFLPKLPPSISLISFPFLRLFLTHMEIRMLIHPYEACVLQMDRLEKRPRNNTEYYRNNSFYTIDEFIQKVNTASEFRKLREDIMENAARIAMHPRRIARLLENGLDFDDTNNIENIFEYQQLAK